MRWGMALGIPKQYENVFLHVYVNIYACICTLENENDNDLTV